MSDDARRFDNTKLQALGIYYEVGKICLTASSFERFFSFVTFITRNRIILTTQVVCWALGRPITVVSRRKKSFIISVGVHNATGCSPRWAREKASFHTQFATVLHEVSIRFLPLRCTCEYTFTETESQVIFVCVC